MFYDTFLNLCEEKHVTPIQVRNDLGISQSTMASWKSRRLTPKYETLKKLADYFDVSINDLLDGDTAGKISTSIDVAMAATYRKSNKLAGYSTHYKQSVVGYCDLLTQTHCGAVGTAIFLLFLIASCRQLKKAVF